MSWSKSTLRRPPIEIGPFGAQIHRARRRGRVALAAPPATPTFPDAAVAFDTSMTLMDGETLTFGFAAAARSATSRSKAPSRGADVRQPGVNARAGLGSPYHVRCRPAMSCRHHPPAARRAPHRPARRCRRADPGGDGAAGRRIRRRHATVSRQRVKISPTSDRMGYRLEGPVIKHLHGHNIVSDGTVNGSIQVPATASRSC